MVIKIKLELAS